MTIRNTLLAAAFTVGLGINTACAGGSYAVRYAPPPTRYGMVGYAPGPGYVWTDGYWDWRGRDYFWVQGSWRRPPHARAVWVPGAWRPNGRGYALRHGYWRR